MKLSYGVVFYRWMMLSVDECSTVKRSQACRGRGQDKPGPRCLYALAETEGSWKDTILLDL